MDPVLVLGVVTVVAVAVVAIVVLGDVTLDLEARWRWFKRFIRQYGWFLGSFALLVAWAVWSLAGHDPAKWEKVVVLGFLSGIPLFVLPVWWAVTRLFDADEYWFVRRRADGSPTKIYELNQAAKDRLQWVRREGERLPGTLHPAWSVYEFDDEDLVAEPTFRGFLSPDELETVRESVQQQWSRIDDEVAAFRQIRRRLAGIVRRLDYQRARAENAVLDDHRHPSFDSDTIDDVIADEVPDEYLPDYLKDGGKDPLADDGDEFNDEAVLADVLTRPIQNGAESSQDAASATGGESSD